jgi:uncharacterized protein YdhG (YjbR/CyaY superfamily)
MNTISEPTKIDAYIAQFDGVCHERLKQVRERIRTLAPQATERIGYGMPAYMLNGKPLVYFAGYANHVGFYATPNGHTAFAKDFAPYKQGKGSVQFPHDQPLPLDLIGRVVEFRVAEVTKGGVK